MTQEKYATLSRARDDMQKQLAAASTLCEERQRELATLRAALEEVRPWLVLAVTNVLYYSY